VRKDGLEHACDFQGYQSVSGGHYEVTVAGDGEIRGCGATGAQIFVTTFDGEELLASQETIDWPADGAELSFDAAFVSEEPEGMGRPATTFRGSVLDSPGETPHTEAQKFIRQGSARRVVGANERSWF